MCGTGEDGGGSGRGDWVAVIRGGEWGGRLQVNKLSGRWGKGRRRQTNEHGSTRIHSYDYEKTKAHRQPLIDLLTLSATFWRRRILFLCYTT